ncbi:16S rRNA (guanine(966)-N(2))-methyltransferase RsmD [Gilvimarinus polysaccharolyticus]|uniref:16S rRNA (guanine(966)-N(2))-methyltransferase RsmD n=1 Tax=Gilvimarinus polysaccharolyticus TaxID=863921 RepID=UPI000673B7CA|nr:16S rRNA (guanine(966)-N(2))-methyltransferase RsmD [Gilvimarinus polysaccharolyticus]
MAKQQRGKPAEATLRQPLRLIGGQWRGRKLHFPLCDGLRPTGDRIRETLFNWLGPYLVDAVGADLYAGSGALGLEALSRGASRMTFCERDPAAAKALANNLTVLGASGGRLQHIDALQWLHTGEINAPLELVFLDPPFAANLWQSSIDALSARGWLADGAAIYIEAGPDSVFQVPDTWMLHREKRAGGVCYRLYFYHSTSKG